MAKRDFKDGNELLAFLLDDYEHQCERAGHILDWPTYMRVQCHMVTEQDCINSRIAMNRVDAAIPTTGE